MPRPIITLTTDFGTADFYVSAMKAQLLEHCPDAQLVDVTHAIRRHDIVAGSIALERAVASFPNRTVHLAVIDPGVGTDRNMLIAEIAGSLVVCPDNGLITWSTRRHTLDSVFSIDSLTAPASNTFHGRDIMAPIAGQLAAGAAASQFGHAIDQPTLLDLNLAKSGTEGVIVHIDHFGNATTNIPAELAADSSVRWQIVQRDIGPLRRTYADVAAGEPLALIGSSGLLEIAVRNGSAAEVLGLRVGDVVVCVFAR